MIDEMRAMIKKSPHADLLREMMDLRPPAPSIYVSNGLETLSDYRRTEKRLKVG
jgi:hypothetical protein